MPAPDFRLAPPPTMVDGLLAVPIDVQHLQATVTLDGATSSAQADVTMTYEVGPAAGNPIFDLRQTIDQAWLDGVPVDPALLAARDAGAGSSSTIRVIGASQAAGSLHTLRVVYALGTPQSQLGGAYPPVLQWSPGPRVRWSFGFSDLNAGRYLEAWFPANLIFDQFPVDLEIQLTGTIAAHSLITNGTATALGANHWEVHFPDWYAPTAHLVELRPSDSLESQTDTVMLPVSGESVTIEAWKLTGGPDNLTTRLNEAKAFLTANETDYGAFLGDRFVIFFHGAAGGMEYAGATTTSAGALNHETFHSWFARGITPSSQADGWWDEGFTTFHDNGADDTEPFDFFDPPVTLCSRQPFQRRTPSNAYSDGSRFFRGVAAQIGAGSLRSAMRALYEANRGNPVSTAMIEEHLPTRTGATALVDAFHRFVYGFADSSPAPRLWLRDDPGHGGADAWEGAFWDSPDLWVRRADDGGTTHQAPEYGQDNWFYARVRNDPAGSACRHFLVTFQVKEFAGTQFVYPGDFLPCVAARAEFELGPGEIRVVAARWPSDRVPPPGTHPCLLAAVLARGDHPAAGTHVWEHANLAQKNLTVVDLLPGEFVILPVLLKSLRGQERTVLEVWRDPRMKGGEIGLVHRTEAFFPGRVKVRPLDLPPIRPELHGHELMDCGGLEPDAERRDRVGGILTSRHPERIARRFPEGVELRIEDKRQVRVPVALAAGNATVVGLKVTAPPAEPGTVFTVHLAHYEAGGKRLVGGVALQVRIAVQETAVS